MVKSLRWRKAPSRFNHLPVLAAAGVCMLSSSVSSAQGSQPRTLLNAARIVEAMQERQLPTRGVQVTIGVPITTTTSDPELDIDALSALNTYDVRLRVSCRDRSACLPFFAIAHYPEAFDPAAFAASAGHKASNDAQPPPATKSHPDTPASSPHTPQALSQEASTVRSGTPATLDFDGERVHVRVEVICLQGGATGDKIRVTTRDHKQIYLAEIVAPGTLKGTLTR